MPTHRTFEKSSWTQFSPSGASEGGWVAPLAANRAKVDFVIVSFGLAVNVLQEDQEEVVLEMSLKGHSTEETAKALEVARAAETVAESRFTRGFCGVRRRASQIQIGTLVQGRARRFYLPPDALH
jgi:DNA-directed RNA polymerase specialized sigma24 family protein